MRDELHFIEASNYNSQWCFSPSIALIELFAIVLYEAQNYNIYKYNLLLLYYRNVNSYNISLKYFNAMQQAQKPLAIFSLHKASAVLMKCASNYKVINNYVDWLSIFMNTRTFQKFILSHVDVFSLAASF